MRRFADLTIRKKLLLANAFPIAALLCLAYVAISTSTILINAFHLSRQFSRLLAQLSDSTKIVATSLISQNLNDLGQMEKDLRANKARINALLVDLKALSPLIDAHRIRNIGIKQVQFHDTAVLLITNHKAEIRRTHIFSEKYPTEKNQRYSLRTRIFLLRNPDLTAELGRMEYYSKETLYQHKDQQHLDKWLASVLTLRHQLTSSQIKAELDAYAETARVMGKMVIEIKQIQQKKATLTAKMRALSREVEDTSNATLDAVRLDVSARTDAALLFLIAAIIVTLASSITASVAISSAISKPIIEATAVAAKIAQGDLHKRVNATSKDEIGTLARAFNQMAENLIKANTGLELKVQERTAALMQSNAELKQFAYVASHDLQEPLRMVASYTQLLAKRYEGRLDADADQFITYAVEGAKRMQTLINDLLAYLRTGSNRQAFEPTACDAILRQILAYLKEAIQESGAVVTHDPLPTVMGDETQLVRLFQDLIGNAIKFRGEQPPQIHVSAQKSGESRGSSVEGPEGGNPEGRNSKSEIRNSPEWVFSVRDNGIGINPEQADRIFGIFQRLHGKTEYPGTGIGLAICKRIIERHGGRIWVESQPGKGSTFYWTLPDRGGTAT